MVSTASIFTKLANAQMHYKEIYGANFATVSRKTWKLRIEIHLRS